jgi:hypothetical protein
MRWKKNFRNNDSRIILLKIKEMIKRMVTHNEEVTLIEAIEILTDPKPEDKDIIEEAVKSLGIKIFLLNIEAYNISEVVKDKLIDLRNIVEEFTNNLPDNHLSQGGGHSG